jgi:hypothetical protein
MPLAHRPLGVPVGGLDRCTLGDRLVLWPGGDAGL